VAQAGSCRLLGVQAVTAEAGEIIQTFTKHVKQLSCCAG